MPATEASGPPSGRAPAEVARTQPIAAKTATTPTYPIRVFMAVLLSATAALGSGSMSVLHSRKTRKRADEVRLPGSRLGASGPPGGKEKAPERGFRESG